MAGRTLWSILMVAWLSAGNAPVPPRDATAINTPVTEQGRDGDVQPALGTASAEWSDSGSASDTTASAR